MTPLVIAFQDPTTILAIAFHFETDDQPLLSSICQSQSDTTNYATSAFGDFVLFANGSLR
jgi:hypothetical protein